MGVEAVVAAGTTGVEGADAAVTTGATTEQEGSGGSRSDRNSVLQCRSKRRERSAAYARQSSALLTLRSVSPCTWIVLSFIHLLRRRCSDSRTRVLQLLTDKPVPTYHDVGYDADRGIFSFRSPTGVISQTHPAATSSACAIPAYDANGKVVPPQHPPDSSSFVLMPEASGAWCYYDTAYGTAQWIAPSGSTSLQTHLLVSPPESFDSPPPRLSPRQLCQETLERNTAWLPIYEDCAHRVLLYHRLTGSKREAPWLALRTPDGRVYFANMITCQTRWFPPHRWMDGWISRPPDEFDGTMFARNRLPRSVARLRVEGGAPYFHESGRPQYDPDGNDTDHTYPLGFCSC